MTFYVVFFFLLLGTSKQEVKVVPNLGPDELYGNTFISDRKLAKIYPNLQKSIANFGNLTFSLASKLILA